MSVLYLESSQAAARIVEDGQFHSERDQRIAEHCANELLGQHTRGNLTAAERDIGITALRSLIPLATDNGKRSIHGKTLPPVVESAIASRLTSTEVDLTARNGSWGSLPAAVKRHLTHYGADLKIEPASHCTVGCSFCTVADKGPIQEKASFGSILAVVDYFAETQDVHYSQPRLDCLYWGSDPFDLKWKGSRNQPERDYLDMSEAYAQHTRHTYRALSHSTAVPLGEELRVLRFAETLPSHADPNRTLRISVTSQNKHRVLAIAAVLAAVRTPSYVASRVHFNIVADHTAARGIRRWPDDATPNAWDIVGPQCRDGVILGVRRADAVYMQGASQERPTGELRVPLEISSEAGRTFRIPRHTAVSDYKPGASFTTIPKDIIMDTVTVTKHGASRTTTELCNNDPHRALYRLAAAELIALPETAYRQRFSQSAQCIRDYLAGGGHNPAMRYTLNRLVDTGYLDETMRPA